MAAIARVASIALDGPDPGRLAHFSADLLEAEVAFESNDFCGVKIGPQSWLSTQRVPDHRSPECPVGTVSQQMHLDLAVDDLDEADLAAVSERARTAETQPSPDRWRALLDPAGHPFCITTLIPE